MNGEYTVYSPKMGIPKNTKIIYLDQNAWIEISRFKEGETSFCDKDLFDQIIEVRDSGKAIFPVSFTHLLEISAINKIEQRKSLLPIMLDISQFYTFKQDYNAIIGFEVENLVLKKLGLPLINIRHTLVGKGVLDFMRSSLTVSSKTLSSDTLEIMSQILLKKLANPEIVSEIMTKIPRQKIEKDELKNFEDMRQHLKKFNTYKQRRYISFWINTEKTILPLLYSSLKRLNVSDTALFAKKIIAGDIEKFFAELPTALCYFTLLFQMTEPYSRKFTVNDLYDIWHLALSIPYCDIVVTDKYCTSIVKQTKLDTICGTKILSSISDLSKIL
ncbi:MAG: hypothetical protein FWG55_03085 [Candidatus Bathyarchaeota archaeon]|nr:hypothetical protein [Candidatus Termiticorpusculum sp.]